jgi:hypothetical protein
MTTCARTRTEGSGSALAAPGSGIDPPGHDAPRLAATTAPHSARKGPRRKIRASPTAVPQPWHPGCQHRLKIGSGSNNVTVTCARPGEGTFRSQLKMMLSKKFGFLVAGTTKKPNIYSQLSCSGGLACHVSVVTITRCATEPVFRRRRHGAGTMPRACDTVGASHRIARTVASGGGDERMGLRLLIERLRCTACSRRRWSPRSW